tara:strand:+ start:1049 stop:1798 length:750 start_codon:yes stop_codon:yes gene_type:complete
MKKSQLRNIIKESIKTLMTEQPVAVDIGASPLHANSGFTFGIGNVTIGGQTPIGGEQFLYTPSGYGSGQKNSDFTSNYLSNKCAEYGELNYFDYPFDIGNPQTVWVITQINSSVNNPNNPINDLQPYNGPALCSYANISNATNNNQVNDPCFFQCTHYKCTQKGNHPKFGSECKVINRSIPYGASNYNILHLTLQDCLASGCEPIQDIGPKTQDITPFTTTPQSMVKPDDRIGTIDPEINRMRDLANIK